MTYRIVFTKRADDDLLEIWSYIAADSPASADRVLSKIFDQIDGLAKFPQAGRVVHDISPHHRLVVQGNYLTIYHLSEADDLVTIVHVTHSARDWRTLFDD